MSTQSLSVARQGLTSRRSLALLLSFGLIGGGLVLAPPAHAQQAAWVASGTSLRAGPDAGYPKVGWIAPGNNVMVYGCVSGYQWCDVASGGLRGWANARHLRYYYQNRYVPIFGIGARYGFPIIGYSVGPYWDSYYRDRPWYGDRYRWDGWRPGYDPRPRYIAPAPVYRAPPPPAFHNPPPPRHVAPPPRVERPHPPRQVYPVHPQVQSHGNPPVNPPNGSLR